jgi:hypothetical protein
MTKPDDKQREKDTSEEGIELSKETLADLDAPEETDEAVKGGPRSTAWTGVMAGPEATCT